MIFQRRSNQIVVDSLIKFFSLTSLFNVAYLNTLLETMAARWTTLVVVELSTKSYGPLWSKVLIALKVGWGICDGVERQQHTFSGKDSGNGEILEIRWNAKVGVEQIGIRG